MLTERAISHAQLLLLGNIEVYFNTLLCHAVILIGIIWRIFWVWNSIKIWIDELTNV